MLVDRALRKVGQRFQFSTRWDHTMQTYRGIAASPGVAMGEAMIMDHEGFRIPRRFVVDDAVNDAVNDEWRRLKVAREEVADEIARNPFLGLRGFSVPPSSIPEVKQICRSVTISQCKEIADQAMSMEDAQQINQFLTRELQKIAPELVA